MVHLMLQVTGTIAYRSLHGRVAQFKEWVRALVSSLLALGVIFWHFRLARKYSRDGNQSRMLLELTSVQGQLSYSFGAVVQFLPFNSERNVSYVGDL